MAFKKVILSYNQIDFDKRLKEYPDYNLNNKEFINSLLSKFSKDAKYTLKEIDDRLRIKTPLRYTGIKESKHHLPRFSMRYWLDRGWDYEYAKQQVLNRYKSSNNRLFFLDNEFRDFIINENPYHFNVNNKLFIDKFIEDAKEYLKYDFYLFISENNLYEFVKKYCAISSNKVNKGYITCQKEYYKVRGYSDEESKQIVSILQSQKSQRCKEYYTIRGYTDEDAEKRVAELQRKYYKKSRYFIEYWLKQGYDKDSAQKKCKEFKKKHCAFAKEYWLNKGYTAEEAEKIVLYNNPSSILYKEYDGNIEAYVNYCEKISQRLQKAYTRRDVCEHMAAKFKEGRMHLISKAEIACFSKLMDVDTRIKHKPYVVLFPENFKSQVNKIFYSCDGYLELDDGHVIVLEYDSEYYHDYKKDNKRDQEILMIDENVLGIIRISEKLFKDKRSASKEIFNNTLQYAIKKIESGEETIIRIEKCL